MKPADYKSYRLANRRYGSHDEVKRWLAECDEAEQAAKLAKRKTWVRNPNFVRFDQMPGYTPIKSD